MIAQERVEAGVHPVGLYFCLLLNNNMKNFVQDYALTP